LAQLLYRLGTFSARHRIAVLAGWLVTLVAVAGIALSGMRFSDGGFEVPGTEASEALSVMNGEFGATGTAGGGSLQLVLQAPAGEKITDPEYATAVADVLTRARGVDKVAQVSNPLDEKQPYVSADGTTAVATLSFAGVGEDEAQTLHAQVLAVAQQARGTGLTAQVGGSLADEVPEILGPTEIIGAVVAFLVLVVMFRSLAAAGANMAGALLGVAVGILGIFAFSAVTPIGSMTPILAVMLGLAVGIDYCLFILDRFRTELREGRTVDDAIGWAVGTAGSAVVFAGATVVIALAGLSVVGIPFLSEMGLAAAFAVVVAVLMALTFLPVLLHTLGARAMPRRTMQASETTSRLCLLDRWIGLVVRRPALTGLACTALLLVMAAPVLSMNTALNIPGGEDPKGTQRAAYDLVADKFGAGSQDPLIVLVQSGDGPVEPHLAAATGYLQRFAGVARVLTAGVSGARTTAMLSITPRSGPIDDATEQLVRDIRAGADSVPGVRISVTGRTALGIDSDEQLGSALVTYLVLIVGLSLLLLVVMFRSLLVPVLATVGFLLSLGAGLGSAVAVFQWGWLDPLFSSPQGNPLLSLLPIILTGILFGLAMDYQVFLVSRMHEAYARGLSPKEAVLDGFGRSAKVVVAAAAIMTAVFVGFALSPSSLVGAIALGLTVGVVADAFIVRMIIMPAMLSLLGRCAWWMPRRLARILPHLDTEGSNLHRAPDDIACVLQTTGAPRS
jgi:putative drug exporter of the RND superfamily